MIHRHEHIYSIHLPMLSMLSSGTCFQLSIPFIASMLLYFYMIHISLQPPVLALVLSSIWEVYSFYSLGVCSTGAQCTWDTQRYILFIYLFSIIYDSLYKLYPSFYIKSGYFFISVLFIRQKSLNLYNEFIIKGQKKRPGTLSRPLHILYHYTNIIP